MVKSIGYWLSGVIMWAIWGLSIADEKKRDYRKKSKKLMTYLWGAA
ncbi:MAG: hypothetical protein K2X94_00135 [Amoebophilaceae bacterium]|nr:hypothetical protein [Amoebophilaceae bacterium]